MTPEPVHQRAGASMPRSPFRLRKVCSTCPFRADEEFMGLSAERVSEIADSLRSGSSFHCHKTLDYDREFETEEEEASVMGPVVESSQICAGALATMEKGGEANQSMRIAERLGLYDPTEFDWEGQPVHEGLDAWESALSKRAPALPDSREAPSTVML